MGREEAVMYACFLASLSSHLCRMPRSAKAENVTAEAKTGALMEKRKLKRRETEDGSGNKVLAVKV